MYRLSVIKKVENTYNYFVGILYYIYIYNIGYFVHIHNYCF